jgi:hypothetical protein
VEGENSDVRGMCNNTRTSIGVGQRNSDGGTGGSHEDHESRTGRLRGADRKKERGKKGQEDVSDTNLPSTRHMVELSLMVPAEPSAEVHIYAKDADLTRSTPNGNRPQALSNAFQVDGACRGSVRVHSPGHQTYQVDAGWVPSASAQHCFLTISIV